MWMSYSQSSEGLSSNIILCCILYIPHTLSSFLVSIMDSNVTNGMFMTLKKHFIRGSYQRQWGITKEGVQHIDPTSLSITNQWPWSEIKGIACSQEKGDDPHTSLVFTLRKGKKEEAMKFQCTERAHLVGEVKKFLAQYNKENYTVYPGCKLTRSSKRTKCLLKVSSTNNFYFKGVFR
jgi:hypothetical protein